MSARPAAFDGPRRAASARPAPHASAEETVALPPEERPAAEENVAIPTTEPTEPTGAGEPGPGDRSATPPPATPADETVVVPTRETAGSPTAPGGATPAPVGTPDISTAPVPGPGAAGKGEEGDEVDLTQAAGRGAAWLTVVTLLAKGSQIVVTLGLAALLSTHDVGLVTITTSLLNIVAMLQMMGVYDVIGRTRAEPARFSGTIVTMSLAISGVLTLVGCLLADWIALELNADGQGNLLRLAFLSLPFAAYSGVQNALMSRRLDFRNRAVSEGVSAIVGSAVTIVLAALGHGAYSSAWGVLVTAVLACAIGLALRVAVLPRFDLGHAREAIGWAAVVGPAAVIALTMMNIDYMVVSRVLGQSANGVYSLAFRIAYMPLVMIGAVILGVAFQVFAELHRRDDVRGLNRTVVDYSSIAGLLIIGLYAIVFAMADHLDLLGTKWTPSVAPLRILCLYGIFFSIAAVALDALRAAGEKGVYLASQVLQLAVLLPAVVVLTAAAGIIGTAWAQVTAAAVATVFSLVMLKRKLHIGLMRAALALIGPTVGAVLVVITYALVQRVAPHHGPDLLMALVTGVGYALVYLGGVHAVDPSLLTRFVGVVKRR